MNKDELLQKLDNILGNLIDNEDVDEAIETLNILINDIRSGYF